MLKNMFVVERHVSFNLCLSPQKNRTFYELRRQMSHTFTILTNEQIYKHASVPTANDTIDMTKHSAIKDARVMIRANKNLQLSAMFQDICRRAFSHFDFQLFFWIQTRMRLWFGCQREPSLQ